MKSIVIDVTRGVAGSVVDAAKKLLGVSSPSAIIFENYWRKCPSCGMPYFETETILPDGALGCEICNDIEHGVNIMSCGHPRSALRCEDAPIVQVAMWCLLCEAEADEVKPLGVNDE